MKILYVFTSASNVAGSVQKKVCSQIDALIANGVECRGLFFSTDNIEQAEVYPNIDFIQVPKIQAKYFRSTKQRTAYFETLLNQKKVDINQFDFVYFRYPGAHNLLKKWLTNLKTKVFFEHVTAETKEIELYKTENPFKFNISAILSLIEFYYLPMLREKFYGSSIRRKAILGICNSEDIATYESKAANLNYKTLVLGDAVQTKKFAIKSNLKLEDEFRIVFLKGAVTSADFNGLDRVFKGIKMYKGLFNIKFYLFGKNLVAEKSLIEQLGIGDHVICSDFIQKEQTDIVINNVHLGIGALAVHRKGLKSTSTIKTREYFARGLPFVYGHNDPDFSNNIEAQKFCLELEASEQAIDFTQIINWYQEIIQEENLQSEMHQYAEKHLDYEVKMGKLVSVLKQIK